MRGRFFTAAALAAVASFLSVSVCYASSPPPWGHITSSDGKHAAYWAKNGDKWLVVVDGVEGPPYDGIVGLAASALTASV